MREAVGSGPDSIDHPGPRYSWPVIASGTVRTYGQAAAQRIARSLIYRACALVSLIWAEYWLLRTEPRIATPEWLARYPVVVPQSVDIDAADGQGDDLPDDFNIYSGGAALTIPSWASRAWTAIGSNPVLATAVSAHYEATGLEIDHPSAAHLAYVASIEGIGSTLADPAHSYQRGAARRFREALRTVLTADEARQLRDAYRIRSSTAHTWTLYGTEETLRHARISLFNPERDAFEITQLGMINEASRLVVTKAVKEAAESL